MKKNIQHGFTLIELLIVIALLGALAVGLLASLDPFEQFKKGADTGTRNTVSEIQQAVIRYYSVKNALPWPEDADLASVKASDDTFKTYITLMTDAGELKSDFITLAGGQLDNVFINFTANSLDFTVCYAPTSKSFKNDANTKYNKDGTIDLSIVDEASRLTYCNDPAHVCYWCVK